MNKLIKGSIAAAAGVALLLGGAGSFALWNSTASVDVGTVSSGTLSLAASGTPVWKNISADVVPSTGTPIDSIANYRIVPGDKLELTQVLKVNATGDNLKATLSYDDATIKALDANGQVLKDALDVALDATGSAIVSPAGGSANSFGVKLNSGISTVTVKLTIDLRGDSLAGVAGQGAKVDLSALTFNLVQAR